MNLKKTLLWSVGSSSLGLLGVTLINILQNGGGPKGLTMEDILGKSPEDAGLHDILALSKARFKQLYHAAACPMMDELTGEYQAMNLPRGIMAAGVDFYTDHFFGPGKWIGKAFTPGESGQGWGYNLFLNSFSGRVTVSRTRRMNTCLDRSAYDDREAFHLDYGPHNRGAVHTMHDELRKINAGLFIGFGSLGLGGGACNPSPFIVYGVPSPWVGL